MTDQPRHPDLFGYDEQDSVGDQDETYIAPDAPMGVQSHGTTSREQRRGETFEDRDRHTSAEVWERDIREPNDIQQLTQPGDEDVTDLDEEAAMLARESPHQADVDIAAEEAAMHEDPQRP
jgi:hypothetical protein